MLLSSTKANRSKCWCLVFRGIVPCFMFNSSGQSTGELYLVSWHIPVVSLPLKVDQQMSCFPSAAFMHRGQVLLHGGACGAAC